MAETGRLHRCVGRGASAPGRRTARRRLHCEVSRRHGVRCLLACGSSSHRIQVVAPEGRAVMRWLDGVPGEPPGGLRHMLGDPHQLRGAWEASAQHVQSASARADAVRIAMKLRIQRLDEAEEASGRRGPSKCRGQAGVPCKARSTWESFSAYGVIFPRCFWIYREHQPPPVFRYIW
jgi:hypothetical protein